MSKLTTSVDEVLINDELSRRPARAPDYAAVNQALVALATAMAESPRSILQKLAQAAFELCNAGSAGISILDSPDSDKFRWRATAGDYARYVGGTMPRDFSPCGTVLDRNHFLLMSDPVRFYPYIAELCSPVREVLLIPFYQGDVAIGTVWVVSHSTETHFDAEDVRLVTSLTKFAGAAVQILHRIDVIDHAERAERKREERFTALVTATSDIVYRMSPDWTEMKPLDGRDLVASNSGPIRNWMQKNIPICEHARIQKAIQTAIDKKQIFELEHQVIRPDGSPGWTVSRAIPILDSHGNIVEWFGTASDATRRRQAEETLSDIRSRMEAALEAGAIGTWSWDVQSDRFFGDDSLARVFSVGSEVVAGGPISGLMRAIHPDDQVRVSDLVTKTVASGDRYEADYRVRKGDGSWRWITARGQVERDANGTAIRFPGVVIDITDRKRVEAELARVTEESERRKRLYEAILSSTPDFVYVFSLDYRTLYANAALIAMWGSGADTIGKTFLELGYEPWHAEMHCREIDQVRATKQSLRGEVPFHGTLGRRIYEYIFVPVFGEDGEVEAVAGTTRDVTERKNFENELRDADQKKDEFIALLAHELRNPLAPIRNGLQVMRLAGGDVTAIANARSMMDRQLNHMVRLIDDLLDVSRIGRNKMELRRGRVLLGDVINSAVEAVKPLLDAAGHQLALSQPSGPIFLDADLTRLAQVIGNLLTNSAKYTPPGGNIQLAAKRQGQEIVVTVRDDGMGIPADFLPHIFDMFSQLDRSVERSTGGLGIGLSLVKGLVEMHGGSVSAASGGVGQGTTITVRLPNSEGQTLPRKPDAQMPIHTKRRLLVVDDNRDGATTLAMMLGLLSNEVRTAHDGLEAIEVAEAFRPDAIFMDVGMPRLNGLDATRRIKSTEWGRRIVIFALTGWGQENDREQTREAGCSGHLVKPVELAELEKVLGEILVE